MISFTNKIAVLLSFISFFPAVGFAATHTVAPLAFNLNVEKREIISETVTLSNTSNQMVRIYPSVHEVSMDGEGTVKAFLEPSAVDRTNTPTSWIEVSRARIELQPGESREVPITIRMNPNTVPGSYSVFVGFARASNYPEAVASVMAGQAPGTLINLIVDQKQDHFLRLARFTVDRFVVGNEGEEGIIYELHNPGSVDVIPEGEIIFYSMTGHEVATMPINPEKNTIQRGETVRFGSAFPSGLGIGKYKAYLSVEYGENLTEGLQDTAFFYVLPLHIIAISFLGIVLFSVVITMYIIRHQRLEIDEHGAESVALYRREGVSQNTSHDIQLIRPQTETEQKHE